MRRISYPLAVMVIAVAAALAGAVPASAVVLVNQPVSSVCTGKNFTAGVWYQQASKGPRAYRVAVYDPHWRLVRYSRGRAPSAHWRFWHVRARQAGRYHTTYRTRDHGTWLRYRVITTARSC